MGGYKTQANDGNKAKNPALAVKEQVHSGGSILVLFFFFAAAAQWTLVIPTQGAKPSNKMNT